MRIGSVGVRLFADGADLAAILDLAADPNIEGFTTNPTLMRKAGVDSYELFARQMLEAVRDRPISFEVVSDESGEIERQALKLAAWGDNVFVKIPITTTRGESNAPLVRALVGAGVKVNVTAIMTVRQVEETHDVLVPDVPAFVSVFAGRIADTGCDPIPVMRESVEVLRPNPAAELIWASPREVLNVVQAAQVGCHVITATPDLLAKLTLLGKDLEQYSLETVQMFHADASAAGYSI